jgi:SAM-dependent methyltransferase
MNDRPDTKRLYTDLAWLWPMWGDHTTEYARYSDYAASLIRQYAQHPVKTLLNISCGGGKNIYNLKNHFHITGLDRSPAMIKLAVALNPECNFVEGDMRNFSLGKTFDAILMDDGISYMTSRADLSAAFACAFQHLKSGGVMVATPDVTAETFNQNDTACARSVECMRPDGIDVVFVENVYDPNPSDEQYEATMIYLIRENGRLRIETDRFTLGLFSLETWKQILFDTGFEIHQDKYVDGDSEYISFACLKP